MVHVLLDNVIETDYGQFDLIWDDDKGFDGDYNRFFDGQRNGLVGAASGHGLYVNLARRSGGSPVRIVLLEEASPPDFDEWEDIVEVSTSIPPDGKPMWTAWDDDHSGPLDLPPGTYRVRASAWGRDAGREGEYAESAVDRYLLEFWPAPYQPDSIIRTTSINAEYWHQAVGGRR